MLRKFFYGIAIILFILLGYLIYDFFSLRNAQYDAVQKKGAETTQDLITDINSILHKVIDSARKFEKDLNQKELTKQQLEEKIKNYATKMPEILGIVMTFKPNYE